MPQGQISDKNTRIAVTISKSLKSDSEKVANEENRSLSNLINTLLTNYVYRTPEHYYGLSETQLLSHAFSCLLETLWDESNNMKDSKIYEQIVDEVLAIRRFTRENHIPLPREIESRF